MNQDLIRLATCLSGTLNDDNTLRKAAEEELNQLGKNPQELLPYLLQLISTSHPDLTSQLKNSAAINLKKAVKEMCDSAGTTKDLRVYLANSIFAVLSSALLDSSVRGSLGYALVPVFSGQSEVLTAFLPNLINTMTSGNCTSLGPIKAIKSIYSGFVQNPVLFPFFKKFLPSFIEIAKNAVGNLQRALHEQNNALAYESTEVLFEWATAINSIFEYFDISSKESVGEIKDIVELPQIFAEIINLVIPDPELAGPSILNISANHLNIKLNQAKTQIFQCFNLILQYLIENKKKIAEKEGSDKVITAVGLDMPDSPYLNSLEGLIPTIMSSLKCLCSLPSIDKLLESEYISEFFVELLLIFNKLTADNRYTQYFIHTYQDLIVNITLPLLKSTLSDIETFEDSPEEFVALNSDICERQESETVKSTAAQMLESLCSKIDGALRFLISFTGQVVDWTISKRDIQEYSDLPMFANSVILSTSEELKIETCLLSICIVSFSAGKRRDLAKMIENLLLTHLNSLYMSGTGLIKNRLCMLIHYYCEFIFVEDDTAFHSLLLVVLNCANPQVNSFPSVNVQASETLNYMLQEEDVIVRIYSYIPEIITSLIQLIDCQHNKAFFEALQETITTNMPLIMPHLALLVPKLIGKVLSEMEERKNKNKKNKTSIIIVKCWNIIRAIIEYHNLTTEQILELESQFSPLLEKIKNPKEIDFDDDIILFEVTVMRRCKTVTNIAWSIFAQLPLVQEKYDNTFVQLFQILNCYIFYGSEVLKNNQEGLALISEMCGKCLFAVYKSKINEATNAEAALIYHQMLYTFKGLLNEILPNILAFAILKLTTPVKNDFFRARLIGIILAGFNYDCALTLRILTTSSTSSGETYFEYIFSEITKNASIFQHPYDKKVAVSGLSSFFSNPELSNTFALIFQIMIEILGNTWKSILPFSPNIKLDEEGALNSIKDSLKDFNSEEMEASLGLTTYLTPLDNFDDYDYFRTLVQSFQRQDLEIFVKSLNKIQVEQLTRILQSKRVSVGENPAHTEVRKIVKAKAKVYN